MSFIYIKQYLVSADLTDLKVRYTETSLGHVGLSPLFKGNWIPTQLATSKPTFLMF